MENQTADFEALDWTEPANAVGFEVLSDEDLDMPDPSGPV